MACSQRRGRASENAFRPEKSTGIERTPLPAGLLQSSERNQARKASSQLDLDPLASRTGGSPALNSLVQPGRFRAGDRTQVKLSVL